MNPTHLLTTHYSKLSPFQKAKEQE